MATRSDADPVGKSSGEAFRDHGRRYRRRRACAVRRAEGSGGPRSERMGGGLTLSSDRSANGSGGARLSRMPPTEARASEWLFGGFRFGAVGLFFYGAALGDQHFAA